MRLRAHLARAREFGAWPWLLMALPLFVLIGIASFLLSPTLFATLLALGILVLAWLAFPRAVIVVFLLLRSSVDGFMELFTFFAGSPLSMNVSGAANSLAVGLGALSVLRRWLHKQPLLVASPGRAYALFLFVCLLSIPGSVDVVGGVKEWARLASGLAIYLMVADVVHDERSVQRFTAVIMASSLAPLALGWLQAVTGGGFFFLGAVGTEFAYRPQGTFGHPARLGSYLVVLITFAVTLYFVVSRGRRVAVLAWIAAAVGCLVLTMARTQWLGMVVAMMVVGLFKRRRLVLIALILGVLLLSSVPLLRERLTATGSVVWRLELWQGGMQLAWPPRWLGLGLGTFPWHINQLLPKVVESAPHNDYLKVGIEMGALGLVTYGIWLLAMLRHAWLAHILAENRAISWRALGLLAVVMAGMVMSVTDNYLGHTAVQWYVWALVALVPRGGRWSADHDRPAALRA